MALWSLATILPILPWALAWSFTDCGSRQTARFMRGQRQVHGGSSVGEPLFYQVSIRQTLNHICGGVIVDDKFVLSAAHCFVTNMERINEYAVVAGSHDFIPDPMEQVRGIKKVHLPRGNLAYNYTVEHNNDLALVEVDSPFEFNKQVGKACLPTEVSYAGQDAFVSGWGSLLEVNDTTNETSGGEWREMDGNWTGLMPTDLQGAIVKIIPNERCSKLYPNELTRSMLCAQHPDRAACRGDSGGPLVVVHSDGRAVVTGIVSWGWDCRNRTYAGVYANVHEFLDFIVPIMENKEPLPAYVPDSCDKNRTMIKFNDGFCDDDLNRPECDYDGGDCCGFVNSLRCTSCVCKL